MIIYLALGLYLMGFSFFAGTALSEGPEYRIFHVVLMFFWPIVFSFIAVREIIKGVRKLMKRLKK